MAVKLGLDAKLYRNTGTYAAPVWNEIKNVKDVTLNLEAGEADVTTRGNNGWRATVATLKDGSIEFEMVWDSADDHGPLALQQILLAGCPTVGVRTGASLVRDGVTGILVERLPPGGQRVENEDDEAALGAYLDALGQAQLLSRRAVREQASIEFGTASIIEAVICALGKVRKIDSTALAGV
jgi:hypothetical protein